MRTEAFTDDPPNQPLVVYDGACPYCRRQMQVLARIDRRGVFRSVPFQDPDLAARYPVLAGSDLERGVRLIDTTGRITVGAEAVYQIARRLPGWRWPALLYRVPPMNWVGRGVYKWVSRNRHRLGVACDEKCDVATDVRP